MDRRSFLLKGSAVFAGAFLLSPSSSFANQGSPGAQQVQPAWLKRFAGWDAGAFLWRRNYRLIMTQCFAGLYAPFWFNRPIHNTLHRYMSNPGMARVEHNRYFIADGCRCHCGRCRAVLWIDTHFNPTLQAAPAAAAAVIDLTGSERYLWVISNQPFVAESPNLPANFRNSLRTWILSRPAKWEGGLLQYFNVCDTSSSGATPVPTAFGVPSGRCDPSLQSESVTMG